MGLLANVRERLIQLILPPTVSSITPSASALAGATAITITGTRFAAGATVFIKDSAEVNRACTTVVVVGPTSITCNTPTGAAGAALVQVRNRNGGGTTKPYTYEAAPVVLSCTPNNGTALGGTAVTIGGTGFLVGAGVKFDGVDATSVVVVSPTSITCVTPAVGAGVVNILVTNTDTQTSGTSGNGLYTYT